MKKDNQFVALTHKLCPICGKKCDDQSEILIHKRLDDISNLHGQVTGFGNPCEECTTAINKGAIMIIVLDSDRGNVDDIREWYRTGNIFGLKEEAITRMIDNLEILEPILKKRAMVMDYRTALEIGLPVNYNPKTGQHN
jgi:hypothetical protein